MATGRHLVFFCSVVEGIGMEFSSRYNALYGQRHAAALLAFMAVLGACAEGASNAMRALHGGKFPTADWLLSRMKALTPEGMLERTQEMLRETVLRAREARTVGPRPVIAVDKTMFARHSKSHDMTWLIKRLMPGTDTAEGYITAKLVGCPVALHLACLPVTRDKFNPDLIRELASKVAMCRIRPRLALFDREFFSTDAMLAMDGLGMRFLMPAVKNSRIRAAVREHAAGRRAAVSRFTIRTDHGTREFAFRLVICRNRKGGAGAPDPADRYAVFATNRMGSVVTPQWADRMYSRRWGIENGYKHTKEVKPRTTSTEPSVRIFLFFTALLVYNQWAAERAGARGPLPLLLFMVLVLLDALAAGIRLAWLPWDPGGP